jgi:dihydroneopterin aldolase
MADRIELRGLRVLGVVGVLAEEQDRAQPLEIDLDVGVDLSRAGVTDDLADTVNYGALCEQVEAIVTSGHVALLEHLAETIAAEVLLDDRIETVTVAVRKLRPPVPSQLATSGVRITRGRTDQGA